MNVLKKILIVEDEGNIFDIINDVMNEPEIKYEFVRARNVSQAKDAYESSNSHFDCYIVDLQIGSKGLIEEEMVDFFKFEGYAWIKNYVFNSMTNDAKQAFKKKTIICSKYITKFQNNYTWEDIEGFKLVHKEPNFKKTMKILINQICN